MTNFEKDNLRFRGFYRGEVVDNNDPSKLGRVKINIIGVFDDFNSIDRQYLPWAIPATSLFAGAGSGFGCFTVPEIGAYVWCFFEAEDFNQPVYFAEALDGVHGLPSERVTNYPSRKVWKTKNGIVIYVDDSSKEIKVSHPSGTYLTIDGSGNITMSGSGNITISGVAVNINP